MRIGAALRISAALFLLGAAPVPRPVDLLIRGGTLVTGRDEPFVGDVAIRGDRIVAVGRRLSLKASREIDANGFIVAPGFIDPHTHMGSALASDDARERLIPAFLLQGVTTAFIGNDGGGSPEIAKMLGSATDKPVGINYAAYVGFGAVREAVIGQARRDPTAPELARMSTLVDRAMCEGALGLSAGLFYAPQSFAKTQEVVALARVAARHGGVYDSHIRDESSYTVGLAAAVDEAIRIGREGGLPTHIAHIKALGIDVQGQAPAIVAKVEAARRKGQRVTADQYPWEASGTSLVASLVPLWAQDGGRPAYLKRFDDPSLSAKLHADMAENLRKRGGASKLLITEGPQRGRTLAEVAGADDPVAAALRVIKIGDPATVSFNQSETDITGFMRQPWVMTGSDASTGHPRVFGSFARKYDRYVRQKRVLSLRQFVERSSTLTASTFGLAGRGRLTAGSFADVVVFDPQRFASRATYAQPTETAAGVQTVIVNGQIAVENGKLTGRAAGRALPHRSTARTCQ
jgi:N-acyl-D-amino-acid deacylase